VSERDLKRMAKQQKALRRKAARHDGQLDPRDRRELERLGGRMAKEMRQGPSTLDEDDDYDG
jgi:hypothetical protein